MAENAAHSTYPDTSYSEDMLNRNAYFLKRCLAELDWKTPVLQRMRSRCTTQVGETCPRKSVAQSQSMGEEITAS